MPLISAGNEVKAAGMAANDEVDKKCIATAISLFFSRLIDFYVGFMQTTKILEKAVHALFFNLRERDSEIEFCSKH